MPDGNYYAFLLQENYILKLKFYNFYNVFCNRLLLIKDNFGTSNNN